MIALALAGCGGPGPVLIAINDAGYSYDVTGELAGYTGLNVVPGETLRLRVEARRTREIHFANMPGMLTFDPHGTTGTLEVFDVSLEDTGWAGREAIVTLTGRDDDGRDFPVSFAFPSDTGATTSR